MSIKSQWAFKAPLDMRDGTVLKRKWLSASETKQNEEEKKSKQNSVDKLTKMCKNLK